MYALRVVALDARRLPPAAFFAAPSPKRTATAEPETKKTVFSQFEIPLAMVGMLAISLVRETDRIDCLSS
jgi:hypothetical protein